MLKKNVHNKANTKGCIAFGFCNKYFRWYLHTRRQMWDVKEEEADVREVLVGKGKHKKLTVEKIKAIYKYIITNSITTKVAYM